jgi:hypothetical protein
MPSTYTLNLGIEKIATGEQSGTWGETTNINFDLLDQAINGIAQVTLPSAGTSGTPNTLDISDGAVSDGRNALIEFVDGGDLLADAFVQLTPDAAEKIVHIRNSLSGGRSIFIFQGTYSASNDFEVVNGADVLLQFSGQGASSTVTDVFLNLHTTALTTNGGAINGATGAFTTLSYSTSLSDGAITITQFIDEDDMVTDSATALPTQQSVKAYTDATATALAIALG